MKEGCAAWFSLFCLLGCYTPESSTLPDTTRDTLVYVEITGGQHVTAVDARHPLLPLSATSPDAFVEVVELEVPLGELCLEPDVVELSGGPSARPVVEPIEIAHIWRWQDGQWAEPAEASTGLLALRTPGGCSRCPVLDTRVERFDELGDVLSHVPLADGTSSLVVTSTTTFIMTEDGVDPIEPPGTRVARAALGPDGAVLMAGVGGDLWRLPKGHDPRTEFALVDTSTISVGEWLLDMRVGEDGSLVQLLKWGEGGRLRWRTDTGWREKPILLLSDEGRVGFARSGVPLASLGSHGVIFWDEAEPRPVRWEGLSTPVSARGVETVDGTEYVFGVTDVVGCRATYSERERSWACLETVPGPEFRTFAAGFGNWAYGGREGFLRLERPGLRSCEYEQIVPHSLRLVGFLGPRELFLGSIRRFDGERPSSFVVRARF